MGVFINCSNHRLSSWTKEQLEAAKQYGELIDFEFPYVASDMSSSAVIEMASEIVDEIMKFSPSVVMCQGEFTLAYHIISMLKEYGVLVVAACSERIVTEKTVNNVVEKTAIFKFAGFREY